MRASQVTTDFTIDSVRAYIAELQNRQVRNQRNPRMRPQPGSLSSSYISGFARGLRAFSTFLYEEGYTETNVLKPLKPPRIQRKVVQVLKQFANQLARIAHHQAARWAPPRPFLDTRRYTL